MLFSVLPLLTIFTVIITSSGCGMPDFPNNPNATTVSVTQKEHEIRLTPIIDGKPIELKLDVSALSRSPATNSACDCGCGKNECSCSLQRQSVSTPITPHVMAPIPEARPQTIEVLTIPGCYACTLALNDLQAAGYEARLVYGAAAESYPTLRFGRKTWVTGGWNSDGSSLREAQRRFGLR